MIQYILLQPQHLADLCAKRVGHGTPKMSQQMISWGNYMGHRRKEPRKEFYTCQSLYKNFSQSRHSATFPEKTRKWKGKEGRESKGRLLAFYEIQDD